MTAFVNESGQFVNIDGKPFVNGKVFIGAQNQDPVLNPITIFSDRALSVVLANPQALDSFGRPANKIFIPATYSMKIEDSAGAQKLLELDNGNDPQIGTTSLTNVQGTNALTAEANPPITAYVDLQQYVFTVLNNNTGQATINIDGRGVKTITGAIAGTLIANKIVSIFFNATTDAMDLGITPGTDLTSPGPIGGTTPDVVNSTNFIGPIGQTSANAVKGTTGEFTTNLKLAAGATVTEIETTLSSSATKIPTSSAVDTAVAGKGGVNKADTDFGLAAGSTTSASLVDYPGPLDVTFTTTGGDLLCWGQVYIRGDTSNGGRIGVQLDSGTSVLASSIIPANVLTSGSTIFFAHLFTGVSVASHTVKVKWLRSAPGTIFSTRTGTFAGGTQSLAVLEV